MSEGEYYVEVALYEDLNNDNEVLLLHLAKIKKAPLIRKHSLFIFIYTYLPIELG